MTSAAGRTGSTRRGGQRQDHRRALRHRRNGYEMAVATLLIRQRATEVGFVAVLGPDGKAGRPWLATTSSGWYAFAERAGAGVRPGRSVVPGPTRAVPLSSGDTTPKTATLTNPGFRGLPIPIRATLPPWCPPGLNLFAALRRGRPFRRGRAPHEAEFVSRRKRPLAARRRQMGDSPDIPVLSPGHLDEREPVAHNLVRCREIACVEASLNGLVGSAVVAVGLVQRRQDGHR